MDEIEVLVRNAHGRVIQSMGGEAEFDKRVLSQLPLVPTDDHVMAIARPCGWQDEWMMKPTKARAKKAAAKAAASGSGNVVDMLANVVFVVCCFGCTFCVCGCLFAFKQTAIHFLCSTSPEAHGVKCIYACQNTKNDWMANVTTVVEWFKHSIHPQSDVLLGFRDVMFYVSDLSNDFSKLLEGS